jgi:carbonic anhydrase
MHDIQRLLGGFKAFRRRYYQEDPTLYQSLCEGQRPATLVITCCDSRVDPALMLGCEPGELFVVRNVANLVPPYEPDTHYHGTSAAVEFGVCNLEIADLVVMGHARCGGIDALYESSRGNPPNGEFISGWISLAQDVADNVKKKHAHLDRDQMLRMMEQRAVLKSIEMLRTFPFVREREADGRLRLHGWFYGIASGVLSVYDEKADRFMDVPDKA